MSAGEQSFFFSLVCRKKKGCSAKMPDVVLINIHGGFPSAMTQRMMEELETVHDLCGSAEVYERVYPTNACAGPAFYDITMDAPLASMTDNCWHPWSHAKTTSRSIFHVFGQNGYKTRLYGAFGLDRRLDPHLHMHMPYDRLQESLKMYGIDEYDLQDSAFTCQLALAHDRAVLERVAETLRDTSRSENTLSVVNLLGCQDAHKCTFHDVDPHKVNIPSMSFERGKYDERIFSESVTCDDPRHEESASHRYDALRRAARLHDWIRGVDSVSLEKEQIIRTITGLHRFSWKCLQQFDNGLSQVLQALRDAERLNDAILYVFSDHPLSLFEHGEHCEAPWDACLRGFLIRKTPHMAAGRFHAPLSLANLPHMLFEDCRIFCDWHVARAPSQTCITLGLAVSWLARANVEPRCDVFDLRTFFVRATVTHNSRLYSIILWFSLSDLARASNLATQRDAPVLSRIYESQLNWNNPILHRTLVEFAQDGAVQMYDLTSDRSELNNLSEHSDWCRSETATEIKRSVDDAMRHHSLEVLPLVIPSNVHALGAERVSICSVQLHHRVRDAIRPLEQVTRPLQSNPEHRVLKTMTTQTEDISLIKALNDTFGTDISSAIAAQLTIRSGPLTVFAPDGLSPDSQLPEWVPPPLRGAHEREAMLDAADRGLLLTDAVSGETHQLTRTANDANVLIRSCRILLQSATSLIYSGGFIIGYRVHHEDISSSDRLLPDVAELCTNEVDQDPTDDSLSIISTTSGTEDALKRKNRTSRQQLGGGAPNYRRTVNAVARIEPIGANVRGSVKAKEQGQNARKR